MDTTDPGETPKLRVEGRRQQSRIEDRLFGRAPEVRIGRFVVVEPLGHGGMGMVYLAHDALLDRKVAVKVLSGVHAETHARLQREAVMLARLNHPHVVTIHDAGMDGSEWFVAMEHVDGGTLRQWCLDRPELTSARTRELLVMALQAADGLAAAHAVGVIHRDVKPANMLLGADGRLRLADFGLARPPSERTTEHPKGSAPDPEPTSLTRTGAIVGTPAYMAPEQLDGEANARSDQFGFCVTFFEALFGVRPFEGSTNAERIAAIEAGRLPSGPSSIPPYVRRVLARGMALRPDDRYPSMRALAEALRRGARRRRRRLWAGVTVLAASAVALARWGVEVQRQRQQRLDTEACIEHGDAIDEIWDKDIGQGLRDVFMETGLHDAQTVADQTVPALDDYARAWNEHNEAACQATIVDGSLDRDDLDKAKWCLEQRRLEFDALVGTLSTADRSVANGAVLMATKLTPVELCTLEEFLSTMPIPASQLREEAVAVRKLLSKAESQSAGGRYERGQATARQALQRARDLGWPPLTAEVMATRAELATKIGDYEQAAMLGEEAFMLALRASAWGAAEDAASELTTLMLHKEQRPERALHWAELSAAVRVQAGDPLQLRKARYLRNQGLVTLALGDPEGAIAHATEAKALYERVVGPNHWLISRMLGDLSNAYRSKGDPTRARELMERGLELDTQLLGPTHPTVAAALDRLLAANAQEGRYDAALEAGQQALEIRTRALPPDHPDIAIAVGNLATYYLTLQQPAEALPLAERELQILEAAYGAGHSSTVSGLDNLASAHQLLGNIDEALELNERALATMEAAGQQDTSKFAGTLVNLGNSYAAKDQPEQAKATYLRAIPILESTLGPTHQHLGLVLHNLGQLHQTTEDYERAASLLRRSVSVFRAKLYPNHPLVATAYSTLGETLVDAGRPADALEPLALSEAARAQQAPTADLAKTRVALAKALLQAPTELGGDRAWACRLLEQASAFFAEHGEGDPGVLGEIESWRGDGECQRR